MERVMAKQDGLQATTEQGGMMGSGVTVEPLKNDLMRPEQGAIVQQNTRSVSPINDTRRHPDPILAQSVATMSFAGFTMDKVCSALRLSESTVRKYYDHEFKNGQSNMVSEIAESLAQRAKAGSDTAAIFLLKTRGHGKFTERNAVELTGKDGNPIEITHRAEVVSRLAGTLAHGITLDGEAEPID
jgi:hypothetical protein